MEQVAQLGARRERKVRDRLIEQADIAEIAESCFLSSLTSDIEHPCPSHPVGRFFSTGRHYIFSLMAGCKVKFTGTVARDSPDEK